MDGFPPVLADAAGLDVVGPVGDDVAHDALADADLVLICRVLLKVAEMLLMIVSNVVSYTAVCRAEKKS